MDQSILATMSPEKRAKIAVGYLMGAVEERPEGSEILFTKLEGYNSSFGELMNAKQQAEKAIHEISIKTERLIGSIDSISEIVAETLPPEKVDEWCSKYVPPGQPGEIDSAEPPKQSKPVDVAGGNQDKNPESADMAGSTASNDGA